MNLPFSGSLFKYLPDWGQPEARSQEFPLGIPHGSRDSNTWTISCAFPGVLVGSWIRSRTVGTESNMMRDVRDASSDIPL